MAVGRMMRLPSSRDDGHPMPLDSPAMIAGGSLFQRHPRNPIITAADLAYPANTVFNPGAAGLEKVIARITCSLSASKLLTLGRASPS